MSDSATSRPRSSTRPLARTPSAPLTARDREALADKWLDEAYEAERIRFGLPSRYIGYWLNRMPT